MARTNFPSGSTWENIVGYSRVVKTGNLVEVSGTTASENGDVVCPGDYYGQTRFILEKIQNCLIEAGSSLKDVVRTRMYVCDISKWEEVAKAHAEFFMDVKPAATMVEVSRLISPDLLVEIEVSAIIEQ
jgi:enamine deaminase RidA (YjgF/YER057c/UK114 family)